MMMNEYQKKARSTAAIEHFSMGQLAVLALGIAGEAGEVADYAKKVIGLNHPIDRNRFRDELGDVLWYVAMIADILGFRLSEIAIANTEKLAARYPNGFESERSINRQE
jgi:NTP pyrophosphatase (non-canonical NTP hydrolase)